MNIFSFTKKLCCGGLFVALLTLTACDNSDYKNDIRAIQKGIYMDEEFMLGMPAFVYSLFSEQPPRYYKLANGEKIDLSDYKHKTSVVINRTSHKLYSMLWKYGEWDNNPSKWKYNVQHFDELIIKPKSYYNTGLGYHPVYVGCDNKPPQSSRNYKYANWITTVENPGSKCK